MFCLYSPANAQCLVVVVQQAVAASREVTIAGLERGWREAVAAVMGPAPDGAAAAPRPQFSLEYCRDSLEAGRQLQRRLAAARGGQRGKALCVVQAPQGSAALTRAWLPALADFPCLDLQPHADDSM
jgi:hypothetical protein